MAVKAATYEVAAENGLNLREGPSVSAMRVSILPYLTQVRRDTGTMAPEGWTAIRCGRKHGYVMTKFLREVTQET